jgi:hypothetical protein
MILTIVDELFIIFLFKITNDHKSKYLEKIDKKFTFGMFFASYEKRRPKRAPLFFMKSLSGAPFLDLTILLKQC